MNANATLIPASENSMSKGKPDSLLRPLCDDYYRKFKAIDMLKVQLADLDTIIPHLKEEAWQRSQINSYGIADYSGEVHGSGVSDRVATDATRNRDTVESKALCAAYEQQAYCHRTINETLKTVRPFEQAFNALPRLDKRIIELRYGQSMQLEALVEAIYIEEQAFDRKGMDISTVCLHIRKMNREFPLDVSYFTQISDKNDNNYRN